MTAPASMDHSTADTLAAELQRIAQRLHGIESRTDAAKVAAELLRLNDAVRTAAKGRLASDAHPQDFAALLLASADRYDQDSTA